MLMRDPVHQWETNRAGQAEKDYYLSSYLTNFRAQQKNAFCEALSSSGKFPSEVSELCWSYHSSPHIFSLTPNPSLTYHRGVAEEKEDPAPQEESEGGKSFRFPSDPPPGLAGNYGPFQVYTPWGIQFRFGSSFNNSPMTYQELRGSIEDFFTRRCDPPCPKPNLFRGQRMGMPPVRRFALEGVVQEVEEEKEEEPAVRDPYPEEFKRLQDAAGANPAPLLDKEELALTMPMDIVIVHNGRAVNEDEVILSGGNRPIPCIGRPYFHNNQPICASTITTTTKTTTTPSHGEAASPSCTHDWSANSPNPADCLEFAGAGVGRGGAGLTMQECEALAQDWARDGLAEHASVAAFAKHTLALLSFGAPSALIEASQRAGADEIRHARLCFGLAAAYSPKGQRIEPSAFPIPDGHVTIERSIEELASATAEEGCVEETVSCILAYVARERATVAAVNEALSGIVDDEARHAAGAWVTLAWAKAKAEKKGDSGAFYTAVAAAFERGIARTTPKPIISDKTLISHPGLGRLDSATIAHNRSLAVQHLVRPWFNALWANDFCFPGFQLPAVNVPPNNPGIEAAARTIHASVADLMTKF